MHRSLFPALLVLATTLPAAADDIFVNNLAGHDTADGRAATGGQGGAGPVKTISHALQLATVGDRIVLAKNDEPYRETIGLSGVHNSGTASEAFIIAGNGAILDGSMPVPTRAWEHVRDDIFRFRPRELGYQMLFRDGKPLAQVRVAPGVLKLPALKPLQWCLVEGHVYLRMEKLKNPIDYQLSHSFLQTGVSLYGVNRVIVTDLIVQGFRYDGLSAADRTTEVRLTSVTLRGNGRSGLSVSGASKVRLESSLVGDNGHAQVRVEYPGEVQIVQSDVLDNTALRFQQLDRGRILLDGKLVP